MGGGGGGGGEEGVFKSALSIFSFQTQPIEMNELIGNL